MSHFLERVSPTSPDGANRSPMVLANCATKIECGRKAIANAGSTTKSALDPRRELYRRMHLEDLREKRRRHVGNAAD